MDAVAKRPAPAAVPARRLPVVPTVLVAGMFPAAYFAFAPLAVEAEDKRSPRAIGAAFRAQHDPTWNSSATDEGLFEDATDALGLDFTHDNAAFGAFRLPEEMGPGVAWIDHDSDGDLDLFVAGGGALFDEGPTQTCRLFRNDIERFVDVSESSGANVRGHAYGAAVADYDADGDEDLLVTRLGTSVLLRNDGGRFSDVSAASGIVDASFGSRAVWFDYDRDGRLDLLVGHYMDWTPELERECSSPAGRRDYCDPTRYRVFARNVLYRNRGDGRFEDVTERAGMSGVHNQTLGLLAADFDGDGWTDVYVAEDSLPAKLWRNRRNGTFAEEALLAGCAFDARGVAIAGMGVACEDLDDDGKLDLFVTNIRGQSHLALLGDGARFRDASHKLGVARWSTAPTGFGVAVFDADLDGRWDMYVANGAVAVSPLAASGASPYAERDQFVSAIGGKFVDRSAQAGFVSAGVGRGAACADFDDDGDVDLAVANNGGRLELLRNRQRGGAWLTVDVRTSAGAPALGARVEVRHGERRQRRDVRPQASYLSSHDPRAHFGLGDARVVDEVTVSWPDGATWSARDVALRTRLRVSRADATREEQR
jgi:hypothetical protein